MRYPRRLATANGSVFTIQIPHVQDPNTVEWLQQKVNIASCTAETTVIYSKCSYRRSSRDFKVSCIDHVEGRVGMSICVCMLGVSMATPKPGDCF